MNILELLEELMLVEEFTNFNLVGGTALALYEGHRLSVDIDLFGNSTIDEEIFVEYNFELIEPIKIIDGIRLVSKKDIAAMKLNAIAGRGSKKDFVDVYINTQNTNIKFLRHGLGESIFFASTT